MIFMSLEDLTINRNENPFGYLIRKISKPEARTPFSQVLLYYFKAYFKEVFEQDNPPELIRNLKDRQAIIFPIGSVLRGTARTESSDLDAMVIYNNDGLPIIDPIGHHIVESIVHEPDYHPRKMSFSEFLAEKLCSNPKFSNFYFDRLEAWKKRVERKRKPSEIEIKRIQSTDFIFCEVEPLVRGRARTLAG